MDSKYYANWEEKIPNDPETGLSIEKVMMTKMQKYEDMFFIFVTGLFL